MTASSPMPTDRTRRAFIFLAPLIAVMAIGFVWPLAQALVNSLHPNTPQGIDTGSWTLANYQRIPDPLYVEILARTLRISLVITAITAVIAYPVALFIARLPPRLEALMILAYVSPWLVNTVVKALGWNLLLRTNGVVNTLLRELDIISVPLRLMLNETGVVIALIPGHFMFALLPLWAALKGLDPALSWAAGTLGARPSAVFWRVVLPLTLPAFIAGLVINFIMNMTAFAIPMLLGGMRNEVTSMLAYQVNLIALDWPFGGALAVALLAFTLALIWFGQRVAELSVPGARRRHA
jgi:ABC-type spermidine/putrescine transport system permease subunit I